jgi:hypothetical protein
MSPRAQSLRNSAPILRSRRPGRTTVLSFLVGSHSFAALGLMVCIGMLSADNSFSDPGSAPNTGRTTGQNHHSHLARMPKVTFPHIPLPVFVFSAPLFVAFTEGHRGKEKGCQRWCPFLICRGSVQKGSVQNLWPKNCQPCSGGGFQLDPQLAQDGQGRAHPVAAKVAHHL